jgi:hypothetical protein
LIILSTSGLELPSVVAKRSAPSMVRLIFATSSARVMPATSRRMASTFWRFSASVSEKPSILASA